MNIDQIIKLRERRESRDSVASRAFNKTFLALTATCQEIDTADVSDATKDVIRRQSIVGVVTAMEIYFRDMLEVIFKVCRPSCFEKALKDLHREKYDIDDLLMIYKKAIHPCELVLGGINFQNMDAVDGVYRRIIGQSLWTRVVGLKLRIANEPATEVEFTEESLREVRDLVATRHDIVHHPVDAADYSRWVGLGGHMSVAALVLCCDVVIGEFIAVNHEESQQSAPPVSGTRGTPAACAPAAPGIPER